MERKPYSAGAVKFSFWFMEFRKTVQLLSEGRNFVDIKKLNEETNIYGAPTKLRAQQIYSTVTARIKTLDESFYPIFLSSDLATQKLFVLTAAILHYKLFFDFVYEVVLEKMILGSDELTDADLWIFFKNKQEQSEKVASFQDYTLRRLGSCYKTQLYESGLLESNRANSTRKLKAAYGADTLEANLDYIAKALGNKGSTGWEIIRNYFLNDFFKDHCRTYSVIGSGKRPIYWSFDSGKQNRFKVRVYLHRYTSDTIGNLRIDYLHKMQRVYESEINRMQDMMDHGENAREVEVAGKRKDKLAKQLKECREYDEKVSHLALSRIELDLDDGVKVNYRKLQTAQDGKFYEVLADSKNIMAKQRGKA